MKQKKLSKQDLLWQVQRTNELILIEFFNRMKGVIHNKHNKSKGFQFALLNKNLKELLEMQQINNNHLEKL